jgi:hypothetical protein
VSFPQTFPQQSVAELMKLATDRSHVDGGRVALAVYELAGYGLYCYFGDVRYLTGAALGADVLMSPEFIQLATEYPQVAARFQELKGMGVATWLIVLKLVVEYGPQVLALVQKLIERIRHSHNS